MIKQQLKSILPQQVATQILGKVLVNWQKIFKLTKIRDLFNFRKIIAATRCIKKIVPVFTALGCSKAELA